MAPQNTQQTAEALTFKELVLTYRHQVLNTCYRFVQNQADAEDIAQEVFMELFRSLPDFQAQSKISTWIYRIAVNKALDWLRQKKRKKRLQWVTSFWSGAARNDEVFAVASAENPLRDLEQAERARILINALAELPESQRVAFTLSQYEGLSYEEIGDIMATTLAAVESLLHRARQNLRKRLYDYYRHAE
jgi:RNA polymerase sigma-70 factor (ECF subfamily)